MENVKWKMENGKCGDGECAAWSREGFLRAVNVVLKERNTLFDDMAKKLDEHPTLKAMLVKMLYDGASISFVPDVKEIALAAMFGFVCERGGRVAVANRIFETRLYNAFFSEMELQSLLYRESARDRSIFIKDDGSLDMPLVLKRFAETFSDVYGDRDARFREDEGRRYFMLYVKPIINGVGNYYIEAETRDGTRTDMVIDYNGRQYVIEMKIWRGESYNQRGERQLAEYLDYFHLDTGYMVSFSFCKDKRPGLKAPIRVGGRTLVEVVV